MKVLLIGMDGAHLDVFDRGWTPFISSLIKNGKQLNIKNDLISRGWLEIATGKHASMTGAMYDKPKADGTPQWDNKFNINDIPRLGTEVKPIWQVLNEKGYRVGIMNVPTAFPAAEVNGFFVSGGGGGAPVVKGATPDFCYPKEIITILQKNNYIVDERFVEIVIDQKITKPDKFFERMENKNAKRTKTFIELSEQYAIDFGFVVFKTSSVFAETMIPPELEKTKNGEHADTELVKAVKRYYKHFDNEIKTLHKTFPEAEIIFVSDHGMTPRKYSVNPNIFLQKNNYQTLSQRNNLKKILIDKLKSIIPFSIKVLLKKSSTITHSSSVPHGFSPSSTLAFCKTIGDWSHGIYINDTLRFSGPVAHADIDPLKNEIISKINADPEVIQHKLRAYSLPGSTKDKLKEFPDIIIDMPNGYVTSDQVKHFIERYDPPKSPSVIASIMRGDMLCLKSHAPLAISNGECWKANAKNKENNLTEVYNMIIDMYDSVKIGKKNGG